MGVQEACDHGRIWVRERRHVRTSSGSLMEDWFCSLASVSIQVLDKLSRVRSDGSLSLRPGQTVEIYLRIDLFHGLLALLQEGRYGWTDALEELTDPIWREGTVPHLVPAWTGSADFGPAAAELSSTLRQFLSALRDLQGWEAMGVVMRRMFVQ